MDTTRLLALPFLIALLYCEFCLLLPVLKTFLKQAANGISERTKRRDKLGHLGRPFVYC